MQSSFLLQLSSIKYHLITLFFVTILISTKEITESSMEIHSFPTVTDTITEEYSLFNADVYQHFMVPVAYVGKDQDVINLGFHTQIPCYISNASPIFHRSPLEQDVSITVDQSQLIGSEFSKIPAPPFFSDPDLLDSILWSCEPPSGRKGILSNPIIIKNTSADTLSTAFGGLLLIALEAKDQAGSWQTVLEPYIVNCGTGLEFIELPPDHIIIGAVPQFRNGSFKTQLRLRLGYRDYAYSNSFEGIIDETWFGAYNNLDE